MANCSLAVRTRSRSRRASMLRACRKEVNVREQNLCRQRRRFCTAAVRGTFIATAITPSRLLTHRLPTRTAAASLADGHNDLALSETRRLEACLCASTFALHTHSWAASMSGFVKISGVCLTPAARHRKAKHHRPDNHLGARPLWIEPGVSRGRGSGQPEAPKHCKHLRHRRQSQRRERRKRQFKKPEYVQSRLRGPLTKRF